MKRWFLLTVVALLTLSGSARADEASKRAKVEELVVVMHVDKLSAQMLTAVEAELKKASTAGENLTPAQKKIVQEYENQSLKIVSNAVDWENMKPDFIDVYMKTFTEEEIAGMIVFYKSPVGQAVLAKMPELSAASIQIAQKRMASVQPQLSELQEHFVEQMEAASAAKKPDTPATKK